MLRTSNFLCCSLSGGFGFSASPFPLKILVEKHGWLNTNCGTMRREFRPPQLQTSFVFPESRLIFKKLHVRTATNQALFLRVESCLIKAEGGKPTCFMQWGNCSFPLLSVLSLYLSMHDLKKERKKMPVCLIKMKCGMRWNNNQALKCILAEAFLQKQHYVGSNVAAIFRSPLHEDQTRELHAWLD